MFDVDCDAILNIGPSADRKRQGLNLLSLFGQFCRGFLFIYDGMEINYVLRGGREDNGFKV